MGNNRGAAQSLAGEEDRERESEEKGVKNREEEEEVRGVCRANKEERGIWGVIYFLSFSFIYLVI